MSIFKRVSIRNYLDKSVEDDKIEMLLRAAMAAPSARNEQPWHFIVIKSRETMLKIAQFHPYAEMLREADLCILVCADKRIITEIGYLALDCAAATQNILLESFNQGLGSCWMGIFPREERMLEMKRLVNLPDEIIPINLVAVGYPKEIRTQEDRFNKDRIRYEKW